MFVCLSIQSLVDKVAKDGDAGVGHAHKVKLAKYWDRCQAQGLAFLPMAVDVFGGWHKQGLATLSKLGGQLARALGKPKAVLSFSPPKGDLPPMGGILVKMPPKCPPL